MFNLSMQDFDALRKMCKIDYLRQTPINGKFKMCHSTFHTVTQHVIYNYISTTIAVFSLMLNKCKIHL